MVAIPLAVGAFTRQASFQPEVVLRNMVIERDVSGCSEDQYSREQRPGCAVYQAVAPGTSIRGLTQTQSLFGSLPLTVVGTGLFKFNGTTATNLGTVANDSLQVQFASTDFGTAVLSAGVLYFHDETTLHTITIPDAEVPVSICSWNSYVIIGCSTGKWFWMVPGDTTIDALHFGDAESMPDGLIGIIAIRSEIFFFGVQSTEIWTGTGDPDIILVRSSGREWDVGLLARGTLQRFDNDALFVGNNGIVYRVDTLPQRVSNPGIEERIRNRTGDPSAFTYTMDGHTIYALYIPGQGTWAFDAETREWAEYTTSGGTAGWRPRVSCMVGSTVLLGDSTSGKVFKLDPTISTDDGIVFERAVSGAVPFHGGRQRNDVIFVHVGSSANINVRLRWHDGPASGWNPYRTKVAKAPTAAVPFWRLGAAKQTCRVIEISTVDNVQFRVSAAFANEGRAN